MIVRLHGESSKTTRKSSRGLLKQGTLFWFTGDPCELKKIPQSLHCAIKKNIKGSERRKTNFFPP
jgi:hypothetical protein